MDMKIVLNLEKTVSVRDMACAKKVHKIFWKEWGWLDGDEKFSSILLVNGEPTLYIGEYNNRSYDWDDTAAVKKCSTFSNPFTNGSICCNVWKARKHKLTTVGDHYYSY